MPFYGSSKGTVQFPVVPTPPGGKYALALLRAATFSEKASPWLGVALEILQAYQYMPSFVPDAGGWDIPGYYIFRGCGNGPGPLLGQYRGLCGDVMMTIVSPNIGVDLAFSEWEPEQGFPGWYIQHNSWEKGFSPPYGPPVFTPPRVPLPYWLPTVWPDDAVPNPFVDVPFGVVNDPFPPTVPWGAIPELRSLPGHEGGRGPASPPPVPPSMVVPIPYPLSRIPDVIPGKPDHVVKPPGKGTKEKKKLIPEQAFHRAVKVIAFGVRQYKDLIHDTYHSLPKNLRRARWGVRGLYPTKSRTQAMAEVVYRNAQHINIVQLMENLAIRNFKYKAYGLQQHVATGAIRSNPYWQSPVGLLAGQTFRPSVRNVKKRSK